MPGPKSLEVFVCLFVCLFCFVLFCFFIYLQIWSLFQPIIIQGYKYVSRSKLRKPCLLCYLIVVTGCSNFFQWFLLDYTGSAQATSHIDPSKLHVWFNFYSTKISTYLKKSWGWGCGSEQRPLNFQRVFALLTFLGCIIPDNLRRMYHRGTRSVMNQINK